MFFSRFPGKHSETRRQHLPDAAAVLCLQGKLFYAHNELNAAVECYVDALKLNPFMWDAFLGLCETGEYRKRIGRMLSLIVQRGQYPRPQHLQDDT